MTAKDTPIEIFLLFPETEPHHTFIKENEGEASEETIQTYLKNMKMFLQSIEIENYDGFYDGDNVSQFLLLYKLFENEYPFYPQFTSTFRNSLKEWDNWRDDHFSTPHQSCFVLGTPIPDSTFCELAQRKINKPESVSLLVNYHALKFEMQSVDVQLDANTIPIPIRLPSMVNDWFAENRIQKRVYHPSDKHGENGKGEWKLKDASKLLCSHEEAKDLLRFAVGVKYSDELYIFDPNNSKYLIFRSEGKNKLNQYHAYHIDESLVSEKIKKLMKWLHLLGSGAKD